MWWEQIQEYLHLTYQIEVENFPIHEPAENDEITALREQIKGDIAWALGPKAKYEITRGQWGREFKEIPLHELVELFKKTFIPSKNVFHSRAQFFNITQQEPETLDEYWKRLVEIEKKNVNSKE